MLNILNIRCERYQELFYEILLSFFGNCNTPPPKLRVLTIILFVDKYQKFLFCGKYVIKMKNSLSERE